MVEPEDKAESEGSAYVALEALALARLAFPDMEDKKDIHPNHMAPDVEVADKVGLEALVALADKVSS